MSLETFGIALREARQARGLSVEQVANSLKINLRVLRAFEEGDLEALPHTVYVRGFARDYGLYLGLDEADMASALAVLSTLGETEGETSIPTVYTPPAATRLRRGKIWLVLLLMLCLAGGGLIWLYRDAEFFSDIQLTRFLPTRPASSVKPAQQTPSTTKKQEPIAHNAGQSATHTQSAPAPSPQPGQTAQPAQSRATQPTQQAQQAQQAQSAQNALNAPANQPASPSPASDAQIYMPQPAPPSSLQAQNVPARTQPAGQHKLVITALAECWVHSSADDTDIRQFALRKGDTFALTFSDKLSLKLGNAGGVRIRYNGTDLPPPGKEGQVRVLTFPSTE